MLLALCPVGTEDHPIEQTTNAPVAVEERMNGFELRAR